MQNFKFKPFGAKLKIFYALHILAYTGRWHKEWREKKIQKIKIIGNYWYNMQTFKFKPFGSTRPYSHTHRVRAQADSRSTSHSEGAKKFKKSKL